MDEEAVMKGLGAGLIVVLCLMVEVDWPKDVDWTNGFEPDRP